MLRNRIEESEVDKAESDAIFMAQIESIDAQKRAGLPPSDVFALQIAAIVEQYNRNVDIESATRSNSAFI